MPLRGREPAGEAEPPAAAEAGSAAEASGRVAPSRDAVLAASSEEVCALAVVGAPVATAGEGDAGDATADTEEGDAKVREPAIAALLSPTPWEPERGIEGEAAAELVETGMGLPVSLSRADELVLRGMLNESRSRVAGR